MGDFQPDFFILSTNIDNAIAASFLAFSGSRIVFGAELERFLQEKLVERKNDELRQQRRLNRLLTVANEHKLTPREIDLVKLLILGKSNKEIAAATRVEVDTVKKHLSSVFKKCSVGSRVELLLLMSSTEGDNSIAV